MDLFSEQKLEQLEENLKNSLNHPGTFMNLPLNGKQEQTDKKILIV